MSSETTATPAEKPYRIVKERTGTVVRAKQQKTVIVTVDRTAQHGRYKKFQSSSKKYYAHDELGCQEGDQVVIEETRPLSKTKRWRVVKKVGHNEVKS